MPNQSISLSNYDPEMARIQRQQRLAEMLQQQAMEPLQPISPNTPISPLSALAKMLQAYGSKRNMDKADTDYADLQKTRQQGLADMLSKQYQVPGQAAQGLPQTDIAPMQTEIGGRALTLPGSQADPNLGAISNAQPARPTTPQEQLANSLSMMSSGNPQAAQMGQQFYAQAAAQQLPKYTSVPGIGLVNTNGPDGKPVVSLAAPEKPENLSETQDIVKQLGAMPPNDPNRKVLEDRLHILTTRAPQAASSGGGRGGYANLSPEENDALTTGIAAGRIDASRVNSRTAKLLAGIALKDPELNMVNSAGHASMVRNAALQRTINVAESLPTVLENVREAGKKLNYSDVAFVGKLQAWGKGQLNDPDFVSYMTQRNDALLSIANVMRGVGMSDMATKMESEASHPSMSPRAIDAWVNAQEKSLAPRLAQYRKNELGDIKPKAAPPAANRSVDDILKAHGL